MNAYPLKRDSEDPGHLQRRREIADAVNSRSQLTMKGETKEEKIFVPQRHLPGRGGLGREGELDEVGVPGAPASK